jgi:hypothetical protein
MASLLRGVDSVPSKQELPTGENILHTLQDSLILKAMRLRHISTISGRMGGLC